MNRGRRLSLKRLALAACVLLIAAFAVISAAVHFLDPRSLATSFAASVKAETGRELRFGAVEVRLLPLPAFALSEVRFANAEWGTQPWLAQIAQVRAAIDPLALLGGRLRIRHIAATGANVFLETDGDGNGNWSLGPTQAGAPAWLKGLQIDELALRSLTLGFRDGASSRTTSMQLDAVRMVSGPASQPIRLSARGSFDGRAVTLQGKLGALAELAANAAAYPVELDARMGTTDVSVRGTIDQPWDAAGCSLALSVRTPEFAELPLLAGTTMPPLGPFRGTAQLTGTPAAPAFSAIAIELGTPGRMHLTASGAVTGRLSGRGSYDWQGIGVDMLLQGEQFGDLAPWLGRSLPALGQYRIAARIAGTVSAPELSALDATFGGHGLPEIRLQGAVANLRSASGMNLRLAAAAHEWWHPRLAADGTRLPPFRASARLRDTRHGYQVDDLEVRIADSSVHASLQVAKAGSLLRISGKASSPLIDLAKLPREPAAAKEASPAAAAKPNGADHWKLVNADLELKIGRLVFADGRELHSGSGRIALEKGRLRASALQARLGGANVRLDGSIADPQNLAGMDLKVAVQGDELAELLRFFGKPIAPVGNYQGQAQLAGSLDALRLTAIDASAGRPGQRLRAVGQIDDARNWQGIQLAITANVSDSAAAGRLFGVDLPRLPAVRATARVSGPQGGYVLDDLRLALGRTVVQGRIAYAPGEPRPRVTATLSGPLVDLSELPSAQSKAGAASPLRAVDVDANIRFARVVLPDRRALGAVSGSARLVAGSVELQQFTVAVDGASATVDGKITDPLMATGLDLMMNAAVTRSAGLSAFTGLRLHNLPAFSASGRLTDVPNGFALADVKLAAAAATFAGNVTVTRGSKRYKVDAKGISPLLDVSAFTGPVAGSTKKPAATGRAIPDLPLPLDFLRAIDGHLDLRFDRVKFGDAEPLGPLLVRATIADAVLQAEHLQVGQQPGQTLTVSGTVDATQSAWALRAEGTGIDFGQMLTRFGRPNVATGGSTDLALQLQGRGNSLPAVLGSLNGEVRIKIGPHRMNHFAMDIAGGLVARAFNLANPFRKVSPHTEVKCFAARLPVKNGVFTSDRRVAVETAQYNLVMSGLVNLRTEAVDVAITPVVTRGLASGEVSTIVRVGGTLAAPTAGVDKVSAVMSAASVGAAIAFPGIGTIADALIRKAMSDPNPCATALAQ